MRDQKASKLLGRDAGYGAVKSKSQLSGLPFFIFSLLYKITAERGCVHSTYARGMGGWVPKGRTLAYGMGGWVQSLRMYKATRPEFFAFSILIAVEGG